MVDDEDLVFLSLKVVSDILSITQREFQLSLPCLVLLGQLLNNNSFSCGLIINCTNPDGHVSFLILSVL